MSQFVHGVFELLQSIRRVCLPRFRKLRRRSLFEQSSCFQPLHPSGSQLSVRCVSSILTECYRQRLRFRCECIVQHHYDGRKALAKNFFMLMDSYQNHPEAKSLGSDGSRVLLTRVAYCNALTLLRTGLLSTSERNPTSTGKKAKI